MSEQRKSAKEGGKQRQAGIGDVCRALWKRIKKTTKRTANRCKEAVKNLPQTIKNGCRAMADRAKKKWRRLMKQAKQNRKEIILHAVQFVLSFASVAYLIGVVMLALNCLLYRLEIPPAMQSGFCVRLSLICAGFAAVMIFTRRQIVTRFCIMAAMPFYFPIFLFNTEYKVLMIPLGLLGIVTFFANGAKEGTKTILGTVYLMFYVLGAFCYLNVLDLLKTSSVETVTEAGISPSGAYRYEIIEVQDQAGGNTYVSLEPNTYDIRYDHCTFYAMGYDKRIYLERPLTDFQPQWLTATRADIKNELIAINPDVAFTMSAAQMELLGLDKGYTKDYKASALSRSQRFALGICISNDLIGDQTPESEGLTLYKKSDIVTLTYQQIKELGLTASVEVKLADLTESDLVALGVPEENDVLLINDKVVFRQLIAVLEDTFDNARSFGYLLE